MSILERNALAHLGVRRSGTIQPLCLSWRSTWNWTRTPAEVTCPQCRAALASRAAGQPAPPGEEPVT